MIAVKIMTVVLCVGTLLALIAAMDVLTHGGLFKNPAWQTLRKLWGGK